MNNDFNNKIYMFSGLGADERVFQSMDFSGFTIIYIKWIVPQKNETIENYATRLLPQIGTSNPMLIGLSFGGLMAVEVAKQIKTKKVILIASAKTRNEIPFYYRFAGNLSVHKILPIILLKKANIITNWLFGVSSTLERQLLKQILTDTDSTFLCWAIDKVVRWKNLTSIPNVFHIHGNKDKILPLSFVKCDSVIQHGGHFMTLNKAEQIMNIIRNQLL